MVRIHAREPSSAVLLSSRIERRRESLPASWNFGISMAVILLGALFLVLYSLFLYKKEQIK